MGQFYKTSKPEFVQDFMYQPPWELAKEVIQAKDKKINEQIELAGELGKVLNFESLDFDKEAADTKKLEYKTKIDALVDKIKEDPVNYTKFASELRDLKNELTTDFTSGEIANIIATHRGAEQFKKDHSKFKDKEGARYNAGYNTFYENARAKREQEGLTKDSKGVWESEQLLNSIDFGKGFMSYVGKLKGDSAINVSSGTDGRYIYKNKSSGEVLSKEKLQNLMKDYILTVPNASQYLDQTQRIGMGNPLDGLMDLAGNFAYSKTATESTFTTNAYGVNQDKLEKSITLANYKDALKNRGLAQEFQGDVEEISALDGLGYAMFNKLYAQSAASGTGPIKRTSNLTIGYGALVADNVLDPKAAKAMKTSVNKRFTDLESFGNLQIQFIPQKDFVANNSPYSRGKTYTMSADEAVRRGLISEYVPNSAQPFAMGAEVQGFNLKFYSKKVTSGGDTISGTDIIRGNIVPRNPNEVGSGPGYRILGNIPEPKKKK